MGRKDIVWLENIADKVFDFVSRMQEDDYSYIRYSCSGDLYGKDDRWGLANTVYAVKALHITKTLDRLSSRQKQNLTDSFLKFSKEDGYIYDPVISKQSFRALLKSFLSPARRHHFRTYEENTKRGETKQVFAALSHLNARPGEPFRNVPKDSAELTAYLDDYNWNTPWHSCAHFAILMFFLKFNDLFFERNDNEGLIREAVSYMDRMQSPEDGCWYTGNVPLYEKVNGAMKYFTGIHAAGIYDFSYPEKVVDTALSSINDEHACNNFNVVYCLYACYKLIPEYRRAEVEEFLYKRLEIYRQFYWDEFGGFSFKNGRANDVLYSARISRGLAEPDIHGTSLFIFGIAVIDEMLGLDLGLTIPVT